MPRAGRTLLVLLDGTSNEFDGTNTNVVRLAAVFKMDNHDEQLVYYQPGIGTWTSPSIPGRINRWIAKTADLAVAWYLSDHIMRAYEFLMNNHLPGDKICIFGFSRGAYTARALAGMLFSIGLLPKANSEQISFAYRMYANQDKLATKFKQTFCKSVSVDFLGVWDTVASVGFIIPRSLPFVSNETIKIFRHAISLDEHRTKFNVTLWQQDSEVTSGEGRNDSAVEEMWFAGTHGDVGGGDVPDDEKPNLSSIPFRWMLHEVVKANCGVLFDNDALDNLKIPIDCVPRVSFIKRPRIASNDTVVGDDEGLSKSKLDGPILSWKGADEQDLAAPMHDELKMNMLWWLVQVPVWTGKRMDFTGQRRYPQDEPRLTHSNIHWTVLERMKQAKGYRPNARLPTDWKEREVTLSPPV